MLEIAVSVRDVSVVLGGHFKALDAVSVDLAQGKVTGIIGPSGAGKTTLIRSIVGRQRVQAGQIEVLGSPPGASVLRPHVSYMTQEVSVYPDLTLQENLQYFTTMTGHAKKERPQIIQSVLRAVHMTDRASVMVRDLSGGQKQRASLAIALIGSPKLMVLDEPTVGLDPVLRDQLWQLFAQLVAGGTTLIISSHSMDEAGRCDDLILIRGGKIIAHDTPVGLRQTTGTENIEQSFLKLVRDDQ